MRWRGMGVLLGALASTLWAATLEFDGPPSVSCAAYCISNGRLTPAIDPFEHPFWDRIRSQATDKAMDIRRQGFFGNAMQPFDNLSYSGIMHILKELDERFIIEKPVTS